MTTIKLLVKKLSENATIPQRCSAAAAGYDLFRYVLPVTTCLSSHQSSPNLSAVTAVVPAQGKAIVISDGIAPMVHNNAFVANYRTSDIWKTTAMPAPITREEPDPISGPRDFTPPNGVKIRISELPPEPEEFRTITPEKAREFFRSGVTAGGMACSFSGGDSAVSSAQVSQALGELL